MRVVVAGATGLIGSELCRTLVETGQEVTALVRSVGAARSVLPSSIRFLHWDIAAAGDWEEAVADADAVVNLAGEPLDAQRWNAAAKQRIRSSRLETTHALVRAWRDTQRQGGVLLNASAVGYYGDCGEAAVTETCRRGDGFLPELCADWEAEATRAAELGARVVLLRTGIVLARHGGVLQRMATPFRYYAGGSLGSGMQWMPWIHLTDEVRMILWAMENQEISGPVNLCAPHPVRMREFVQTLGRILRRPAILRVPALALRLLLGEMADVVLSSQRVVPDVASRAGFSWSYPRVESALTDLLGS